MLLAPRCRALALCPQALLALGLALALPALAQTPLHLRGDVISMPWTAADEPLRLRLRDGSAVDVALAFNFQSVELAPTDHARLVPGMFVGVVSEPSSAGVPHALLVLVYYRGFEGGGEGREPWDLTPHSTMARGTIAGIVPDGHSRTLTLRVAGREEDVRVDDDVPLVAMLGGGHTRLDAGEHVFVTATRQRDGTLSAGRIYFGSKGYVPPL